MTKQKFAQQNNVKPKLCRSNRTFMYWVNGVSIILLREAVKTTRHVSTVMVTFLTWIHFLFCPSILSTRNQCVIVRLFCNISRCLPNPSMPGANEQWRPEWNMIQVSTQTSLRCKISTINREKSLGFPYWLTKVEHDPRQDGSEQSRKIL